MAVLTRPTRRAGRQSLALARFPRADPPPHCAAAAPRPGPREPGPRPPTCPAGRRRGSLQARAPVRADPGLAHPSVTLRAWPRPHTREVDQLSSEIGSQAFPRSLMNSFDSFHPRWPLSVLLVFCGRKGRGEGSENSLTPAELSAGPEGRTPSPRTPAWKLCAHRPHPRGQELSLLPAPTSPVSSSRSPSSRGSSSAAAQPCRSKALTQCCQVR